MNIEDFKYVLKIAECGSLRKAASELFVSQPSLSQRIRVIESHYHTTIFSRNASGMELTPSGKIFLSYAKQIVDHDNDLKNAIEIQGRSEGKLRIGFFNSINSRLLQEFIRLFGEEYPSIQFSIARKHTVALVSDMLENRLDVALCFSPQQSPKLQYVHMFDDCFIMYPAKDSALGKAILANNYERGSYISADLLNGQRFTVPAENTPTYLYFNNVIRQCDITPQLQYLCGEAELMYFMAKEGFASTVLSRSFIAHTRHDDNYYYIDAPVVNREPIKLVCRKESYIYDLAHHVLSIIKTVNNMLNIYTPFE